MTNLSFYLYLISVLESLTTLLIFFAILGIVLMVFLPAKGAEMFSKDHIPFSGIFMKLPWFIFILSIVLLIIIPSEDTLYKILLVEYGEDFINSDDFRQIYEKSFNSLDSILNKYNGVN